VNHGKQYFIFNIGTCYSIVSCSPLILIGAHFSSLAINQLDDLSLFKNMMKKRPCSEITAFKNSDPEPVFVSLLRSPGIDIQPDGQVYDPTLLDSSNVRLNWNIESDMNVNSLNCIKFKNFLSLY
jgi:hypothetical protein